ncbi:MAG: sugar nucleotide-binding protein, partial [Acaryochloridaceae cyanobacterium RL_2_7]|nr:sugar nucleotide-binding protein [Acaryochloridaceae cyanobacterium RL_2_7]
KGIVLGLKKATGLLHLAGPESLSRYDVGCNLARILGVDETLVRGCLQAEVKMAAPRPRDLTMIDQLAQALGYSPVTMEEALKNKIFAK